MFRLEDHRIQDHLRETSLRELGALRILIKSLRVINNSREEISSVVIMADHNQGTIATDNVVCTIDWIKLLKFTVRILVLVVLVSRMHLEFREDLVEVFILVDSMAIK